MVAEPGQAALIAEEDSMQGDGVQVVSLSELSGKVTLADFDGKPIVIHDVSETENQIKAAVDGGDALLWDVSKTQAEKIRAGFAKLAATGRADSPIGATIEKTGRGFKLV